MAVKRLALLALYPLLVLALAYTALRYIVALVCNPDRACMIAYMIDETANVDANGPRNETISARAAKAAQHGAGWGCMLCWLLDRIQPNHCENAVENDHAT